MIRLTISFIRKNRDRFADICRKSSNMHCSYTIQKVYFSMISSSQEFQTLINHQTSNIPTEHKAISILRLAENINTKNTLLLNAPTIYLVAEQRIWSLTKTKSTTDINREETFTAFI